jgi:metal-sulfur cluster biosynthetic enzyme
MREEVPCEFPAGKDGALILERLAQLLDPELDESILDLGIVRSVEIIPVMPRSRCSCRPAGARSISPI